MRNLILLTVLWTVAAGCRLENAVDGKAASDETGAADVDDTDSGAAPCVASEEICDGLDNDCDGDIDEGLDQTYYPDRDGDGWGDGADPVEACAPPSGFVDRDGDCDDGDAAVHPDAPELCNEADDDCDGLIDEDLDVQTWYADADGDGWGDPDAPVEDCDQPPDTTDQLSDCDDGDATRHLCRSCAEVLDRGWSTGDGTYTLQTDGCGTVSVFCDMTTDGGGWTEVVTLDFDVDTCPGDWQPADLGFDRVCARVASDSAEFTRTALFSDCGIEHTALRGNATLYQFGSTDAFGDFPSTSIDEAYGDVVSVTVDDPRQHVFSWVFGFMSGGTDDSNCPDIGGAAPPAIVGGDYLCATGNPSSSGNDRIWFDSPLFAADWFQVTLDTSRTGDLEVRLIGTHNSADEDMGVAALRLQLR